MTVILKRETQVPLIPDSAKYPVLFEMKLLASLY